jgi:hypothetical protein
MSETSVERLIQSSPRALCGIALIVPDSIRSDSRTTPR